ncbi:MAG: hypothetical protein GY792_27620 [Gammaproteobacteria bacterium]|nr:hypothetical protein [Gammaproteobacteria bacterium]
MLRINFFEKLSIGKKIGLGFGLTSLLFIIVVSQYHLTLFRALSDYENLQSVYEAQKFHALNIHRYLLEARRYEKDFLARKGTEYVEQVKKHVEMVLAEAEALGAIKKRTGAPLVAARISEYMKIYHASFLAIVRAWEIKGLDHESGLQGHFRESIHRVEAKAMGYKTGKLYLTLLQIRRGEKDLGLRHSIQYAERVRKLGQHFYTQLGASALNAEAKSTLKEAMEDYLREFDEYANRVRENEDVAGGMGAFRDVAHRLEGMLRVRYIPDLEEDILMLRRHEKDYLLRGDKSYVDKARLAVQIILDNISGAEITNGEKQALSDQMQGYEKDFLSLVEQNDQITALTAQMLHAAHQIEPLVATNVQEAISHMKQASIGTRKHSEMKAFLALSLSILAVLLGVYFSVLIARRITHPVATLMGLAELVSGAASESEEERNKDEIAALARVMGHMAGSYQQTLIELGEHTDTLEQTAARLNTAYTAFEDLALETGEPRNAPANRDKSTKEISRLRYLLRQSNDNLADTVGSLRKMLVRQ